jgi:hypothetical protein
MGDSLDARSEVDTTIKPVKRMSKDLPPMGASQDSWIVFIFTYQLPTKM